MSISIMPWWPAFRIFTIALALDWRDLSTNCLHAHSVIYRPHGAAVCSRASLHKEKMCLCSYVSRLRPCYLCCLFNALRVDIMQPSVTLCPYSYWLLFCERSIIVKWRCSRVDASTKGSPTMWLSREIAPCDLESIVKLPALSLLQTISHREIALPMC